MAGRGQWRIVAQVVTERQRELGLSQQELVARSGVSAATVRKLQSASSTGFRAGTLARVSEALDWPADTLARVLEGAAPPRRSRRTTRSTRGVRLVTLVEQLAPHEARAVQRLVEELVRGPRRSERG